MERLGNARDDLQPPSSEVSQCSCGALGLGLAADGSSGPTQLWATLQRCSPATFASQGSMDSNMSEQAPLSELWPHEGVPGRVAAGGAAPEAVGQLEAQLAALRVGL